MATENEAQEAHERGAIIYDEFPVPFGSSGLRDKVENLTDRVAMAAGRGFYCYNVAIEKTRPGEEFFVAGDLRSSTDRLMYWVARGIDFAGGRPVTLGKVPTETAALHAQEYHLDGKRGRGLWMVTASHNPDTDNGMKPYTGDGRELLKGDEDNVLAYITIAYNEVAHLFNADGSAKTAVGDYVAALNRLAAEQHEAALDGFRERYTTFFADTPLTGKRYLVYRQSAVGRDLLVKLLKALGATVFADKDSPTFVSVDSEAVSEDVRDKVRNWVNEYAGKGQPLDAVLTLDGDSDRPLVFDENGDYITGDVLGIEVTKFLEIKKVTVPVTRNSAVDAAAGPAGYEVTDSDVGSPFIIAKGRTGWEANGGYLLCETVTRKGNALTPLPTRCAFLPILSALTAAAEKNQTLSQLYADHKIKNHADRIQEFPVALANEIMQRISPLLNSGMIAVDFIARTVTREGTAPTSFSAAPGDARKMEAIRGYIERRFAKLGSSGVAWIGSLTPTSGVRIRFRDERIVHLRSSQNAPEFRIYACAEQDVESMVSVTRREVVPEMVADIMADRFGLSFWIRDQAVAAIREILERLAGEKPLDLCTRDGTRMSVILARDESGLNLTVKFPYRPAKPVRGWKQLPPVFREWLKTRVS